MTDERPYGRHFASRNEDDHIEAPHGPEADSAPVEPDEQVQEAAQPDCESSCVSSECAESSEDVDCQAEAAEQASEDIDQSDTKPSRKRVVGITVLVVLFIIAMIAAGIALFVNHSIAQGRRKFEDSMQHMIDQSGSTIEHDGVTYRLNENMVTVAFIGFDNQVRNLTTGEATTGQADAIMIMALNTDTGRATCISIPRDSWVDVDTYIDGSYSGQNKMQLCLQYTYGSSNEQSSELVTQAASRILSGIPIDYYFTLNVRGIAPLADAIGGVTLTPVQTVPGYDIYEGVETTLSGTRAEKYVRNRDGSNDSSSLDRQARQLSFIKAFFKQALQSAAGDPSKLLSLYQTALNYTWTNLGMDEFSYIASTMIGQGVSGVDVVSLQGEMSSEGNHAALYLDQDSVFQTVLDVFYTPES
mgnify:FL=1